MVTYNAQDLGKWIFIVVALCSLVAFFGFSGSSSFTTASTGSDRTTQPADTMTEKERVARSSPMFAFCVGVESELGWACAWDLQCMQSAGCDAAERRCQHLPVSQGRLNVAVLRKLMKHGPCSHQKGGDSKKLIWRASTCYNQGREMAFNVFYHLFVAGFDHILVYDEQSTDGTQELLAPFIELGLVTFHNVQQRHAQLASYAHAQKHAAEAGVEWIQYGDADELIYHPLGKCIHEWMDPFENRPKVSVLSLGWFFVRPSSEMQFPHSIRDTIISCSKYTSMGIWDPKGHVKSFCRPTKSDANHVHFCKPHRGTEQVTASGELCNHTESLKGKGSPWCLPAKPALNLPFILHYWRTDAYAYVGWHVERGRGSVPDDKNRKNVANAIWDYFELGIKSFALRNFTMNHTVPNLTRSLQSVQALFNRAILD